MVIISGKQRLHKQINPEFLMKTKLYCICIAMALLASGSVARSASITWTNAAGGNWNTAQNWNPNQVPGSGDSASIPGGGINVIIDSTNSTGGGLPWGSDGLGWP